MQGHSGRDRSQRRNINTANKTSTDLGRETNGSSRCFQRKPEKVARSFPGNAQPPQQCRLEASSILLNRWCWDTWIPTGRSEAGPRPNTYAKINSK